MLNEWQRLQLLLLLDRMDAAIAEAKNAYAEVARTIELMAGSDVR